MIYYPVPSIEMSARQHRGRVSKVLTGQTTNMSEENNAIEFNIVWESDRHLQTIYANHFYITHAGDEFYLMFGELPSPNIANMAPDKIRDYLGDSLEIRPLVRLAIAPQTMLRIAEAIQTNVSNYIGKNIGGKDDEE